MIRLARLALIAALDGLLCLVTLSCDDADSGRPTVERTVLSDGRVELSYAAGGPVREDTLVADVSIGSIEGGGPTTFGSVRGIAVGDDGTIYVFDAQSSEVRVFAADGSYLRTLSRPGQGPGEIAQGHGLARAPDGTLWINDSRNRAIIGLSPDGEEVGRHPLMVGGFSFYWSGSIDSRGVFWERWSHDIEETPFDITATSPVESTNRVYYKSFDPRTEAYDSVEIGIVFSRAYRAATDRGQLMMAIPFSSGFLATIDPQANIWAAPADGYVVTKMNTAGDTLIVLRNQATALPVTEEDLERWRESAAGTFERAPGIRADVEALVPDQHPLLAGLVTDDQGRIWVGRTVPPDEAPLFDVYDTNGNFLSPVRLFQRMSTQVAPVIRGGRVYALVLGEFDEPYVVSAPLPASLRGVATAPSG